MNALNAAAEFVDEAENLTGEEKEKLKASLIHLTKEDDQTELAASLFKRIVSKAGPAVGDGLKQSLVSVLSAAAKRALGL